MQISDTQAEQVPPNPRPGDFPPKLLWRENADFKFSVNNEGEDVNEKPRSRENITASLSTAKATPTTRDRGTEEQGTGISEAL